MTGDLHQIDMVDAERLERPAPRRVSLTAEGMLGSEILKIAAEVRAMIEAGDAVCNLTVGDFAPAEFRIPRALETRIAEALAKGETNYPPSSGIPALRKAIGAFYERWRGLRYPLDSILVMSGARPAIYGIYRTLLDPGDRVVYPVPSWNNNHYCHVVGAEGVPVVCRPEDAFLPTRAVLEDAVARARLLVLNSPANPTGTAFTADQLAAICDLVLEENARRAGRERPLYVMYDQVYWMLTFGDTTHVDPVSLRPAMRDYTIMVDAISKAFAATGLRVGWAVGPADVMARMSDLLGHVGAWAPRAEQVAVAQLLDRDDEIRAFRDEFLAGVQLRLDALHAMLNELRDAGHPVGVIPPMGAIYLTARFDLVGRRAADGTALDTNDAIRRYLLREAGLAVVPFQAFGATDDSGWFRLSVGAVSMREIEELRPRLGRALEGVR